MSKKWEYYKENNDEADRLQEKFKINKLLATILANRGITEEKARVFLKPTRNDFHDPFNMPDMDKAVERILKAKENKEKVIIYGDYDVDGITSITVLKSFLKDIGIEAAEYIPNRLNEGYGLNKEAIEKIAEEKYSLMITVDCGITGIEEIEYAKQYGIETIVTDHHEPTNELPQAVAVVDCKRKDNKYPFRELAGVGVVFKLTQAIGITLKLQEKEYLKYLDIVALGTISDIVPLVDENRVITKLGLKLIEQTRNYGLKALVNSNGYGRIDSTSISYGVAPKINACGRMGFANKALKLLLSKNIDEATEKLTDIIKFNNERQSLERKIYDEAIEKIEKEHLDNREISSIVLGGYGWHTGVIGIVASKITDLYYKPCILICFDEDSDIGKGSGRSIPGFDLHDALTKCTDILEGFGGHSMAVGVAVSKNNFDNLKEKFEKLTNEADIQNVVPVINIDMLLNIDEVTKSMVESLNLLEPYGEANKMPIFAFKNLKIDSIRALTEGKHLKLTLKSNNNTYVDAIGFNLGYMVEEYRIGDRVDVVGNLEINSFNGVDSIQINLKDLMKTI